MEDYHNNKGFSNIISNPFHFTWCDNSLKVILVFIVVYVMAITLYISTKKIIVGEKNTALQNGVMQPK